MVVAMLGGFLVSVNGSLTAEREWRRPRLALACDLASHSSTSRRPLRLLLSRIGLDR
jgi:hypothetical protein